MKNSTCNFKMLPTVPRKWFGSADCDNMYTIYLSLPTQTAHPNPFRGAHCIIQKNILSMICFDAKVTQGFYNPKKDYFIPSGPPYFSLLLFRPQSEIDILTFTKTFIPPPPFERIK